MVTLIKYGALSGGEKYNVNQMWIDGLSTDSKPTTTVEGLYIPNGSVYTEVNTGKTYMFDEDNATWYEVSIGGGGGGGGFTPTTAQLAAMNSGIDSTKVEQIETNKNNILSKANTSDVNSTTANLQGQIDNIVIASSAEAVVAPEVMQARGTYPTLNARINSLDMFINGGSETIAAHYDEKFSMSIQNSVVYKSNKIVIPSKAIITEIKYYVQTLPAASAENYIFILTNTNVILDKIAFTPTTTGWNAVSLNKSYPSESYIAVSRGGIGYTYILTEMSNIYSQGLFESSQASYGVGQTMSFSHNVTNRYYEFGIEVSIESKGIDNSEYVLKDNLVPRTVRTKETGYTLIGRWYEKEINDIPSACCNSAGASIMFKVKNGTKFTVDIEQIVHPLHPDYVMAVEPYLAYSIDGSDFTRVQVGTSGIDIALNTTDEHIVWIVVDGMCQSSGGANRTTGWSGVYIKSLTSDGDMYKVTPVSKQILFVGDSIVEGINVLGSTSTSESNSNIKEFAFKTARKLNAFPLMQGYGGTATANGIQNEKYSIVDYSIDSFLEIMKPDIIVVEYGYNDQNAGETSAEFTTYYTTLLDLLSSHYAGAVLFCLIPFKQSFVSEIRAIVASRKNCYLIETADYDISYTDTAHPNEAGAEEIATRLSEDIIKIMSKNFFI